MTTSKSKFWKLLTLAEIVDNLIPDSEPVIVRTAITKKATADSINLNMTKTSQEARKVEDQLAADLEKQYRKVMADPSKDFGVLQRKYGPEVEKVIRGAVQKLYLIGSDYTTKALGTTAFITQTDLTNIKKQVGIATDAFWKRISNAVHKQEFTIIPTTIKIKVAQVGDPTVEDPFGLSEDAPAESDPETDSTFLATLIATTTLALSTLAKLDQLPSEEKRKLVWVAEQDDRTCQICLGLNGQEWDEGDPDIPMPVQDSHINCRCRLLIGNDNGDILVG